MNNGIDSKYYCWIAIIPGWIIGDFVGAIASFLLVKEFYPLKIIFEKKTTTQFVITYELALLKLSSLLINADKKVDKREVKFVKSYFTKTFGRYQSKKLFKQLKEENISSDIKELASIIAKQIDSSKYYSMIMFLFQIAVSDDDINKAEDDFIKKVASHLGVDKSDLESIRSQFVKPKSKKYSSKAQEYLDILGLDENATIKDIKSAYRTKAKKYHPDKLAGMSDGIIKMAKEKFQKIQEAYEYLIKNHV